MHLELGSGFDSAYWQKVDPARGDPEASVTALTQVGWLAALIPAKYGGSGLGQVAPISTNLIHSHVAEPLLGLPRSF